MQIYMEFSASLYTNMYRCRNTSQLQYHFCMLLSAFLLKCMPVIILRHISHKRIEHELDLPVITVINIHHACTWHPTVTLELHESTFATLDETIGHNPSFQGCVLGHVLLLYSYLRAHCIKCLFSTILPVEI